LAVRPHRPLVCDNSIATKDREAKSEEAELTKGTKGRQPEKGGPYLHLR